MVQRRSARFVKKDNRSTTSVTALIDEMGWDTLEHRRQTSRLTVMYKADVDVDVVDLRAQADASMPVSNNNVKLYNISNF